MMVTSLKFEVAGTFSATPEMCQVDNKTVLVMPVALNDTDRLVQAATIGTVPADGWALHGFQLPMLVLAIEPRLQADVPDHVEQKIVITVSYEARKNAVTVHGRNQQV